MSNEQKKVVAGAAAAVVFSVAFFELAFRQTAIDLMPPGGVEMWWRLEYALKCEVFAALCLLAGVGARVRLQPYLCLGDHPVHP